MEKIRYFIDLVRHLDRHLEHLTRDYGTWTYAILALIIFCETGLVVTPFLPGDSLLFAAGAVSRLGQINPVVLSVILIAAAIIGDTVNYHVGKAVGPRVMKSETSRWLNKQHLRRTEEFFEKYGGKTIVLARFVPIVRTFAPFVAGAGSMSYSRFIVYNIAGAVAWVSIFVSLGYAFAQQPFVRKNFSIVIIAIIIISVLPAVFEFWRARKAAAAEKAPVQPNT